MNFKKIMAGVLAGSMAAAMAVPVFADDTEYHAYLCFQTEVYSYRDAVDTTNGIGSGYDYGKVHYRGDVTTDTDGTFVDAVITGDGTYTVSVSGLNWAADEFPTNGKYNLIFVSTDIPVASEDAGATYTIDELKIGDKVVTDFTTLTNYDDVKVGDEDKTGVQISAYNMWGDNNSIGSYDALSSEISITFTVSGLDGFSGAPTAEAYSAPTGDAAPVVYLAAIVALAGVAMVASKKVRA